MIPESITFTSKEGIRTEYDRDFIAGAKLADGMFSISCKADMPDIAEVTALITAQGMYNFFSHDNTPKLRRLRIMTRHIHLWGKLVRAFYNDIMLDEEAHHE